MIEAAKESISISKPEYYALNEVRGLPQDAFYMVVGAKENDGRYVLTGTEETFDALTSFLAEEIYEQLSPRSRIKHLSKLYGRLAPDGEF